MRVSTARQAEHDVSIPDQKRQGEAYCASRGYELGRDLCGAGRLRHQRPPTRVPAHDRGGHVASPRPSTWSIVHSFSRFFRDHFELEFYVRKLAKNGVKLVSITQEMGDDPMHVMMRQIMALFDEYQSKENAKHVLRALKENARQGFWNGSLPPIGYRIVAAEQRGVEGQEEAGDRPAARRHGAADLPAFARGRRHVRPDGRQEHHLLISTPPHLHPRRRALGHRRKFIAS